MLQINQLSFAHDAPVLQDVSLQVGAGTVAFVLGPSGCGKSTLLQCVAGLLPDGGAVRWNGEPLGAAHERGVGMLFQEPALFPHMNVWQNVAFSFKYQKMPRPQWREAAMPWLELVGLVGKADAQVDELSGGQRQRVALARTLAARPRGVLLDEPLSALDKELREELGMSIRDLLKQANAAVLWVTHDEDEATRLGDIVYRMRDGRLEAL